MLYIILYKTIYSLIMFNLIFISDLYALELLHCDELEVKLPVGVSSDSCEQTEGSKDGQWVLKCKLEQEDVHEVPIKAPRLINDMIRHNRM